MSKASTIVLCQISSLTALVWQSATRAKVSSCSKDVSHRQLPHLKRTTFGRGVGAEP